MRGIGETVLINFVVRDYTDEEKKELEEKERAECYLTESSRERSSRII